MRKIVSFFGQDTEAFRFLNRKAQAYAMEKGMEYEWVLQKSFDKRKVIQTLREADAGIIDIEPYDRDIFSEICGRTQILVRFGVGYDNVNLEDASKYGIAIARTRGANTLGVAEMALSLILASRRKLQMNHQLVLDGNWEKIVTHETVGSTIGILGFGAIGQTLARLVRGIGCKVIAYDPYPDTKTMKELGVSSVGIRDIFMSADVISIHMPLCASTYGFVNEEKLRLMKKTAILVNTSRGEIINEEDLYWALREKKIAGAALDVFCQEPLPVDSPLCTLDNILLTPHTSSQTYESLWRIYKMAIDITGDFWKGKEPEEILNPDYRKRRQYA